MAKLWNPWRGLSGLPGSIWLLAVASFVNRLGQMVVPFMVLYLTAERGFTPVNAGYVLAAYGLASIVAAPIAGRLCDVIGAERVLRGTLAGGGLALWVFPLARTPVEIFAAAIALAFIAEAHRPASLAAFAHHAPGGQRKAAFALQRLAINLGMSAGPAVGGLLSLWSFRALFWVDGATSIAAAALLVALRPPAPGRHGGADAARDPRDAAGTRTHADPAGDAGSIPVPEPVPPGAERRAFRDGRLIYALASFLPIGIVFFQHSSTMALDMTGGLGLSRAIYGAMFTINTLVVVVLEVPLNIAMADWPHRRALALGALLVGAGFGGMAVARNVPAIVVTVLVWTFGEMILLPALSAYVADLAPAGRSGEYMGMYTMSFGISFVLGPAIGTQILARFGAIVLWSAMGVIGVVSTILLSRVVDPRAAGQGGAGRDGG